MNRKNLFERIDPLCEIPTNIACTTNTPNCLPLFSKSEIGDYCRHLFSQLKPQDRDTVIENYCLKFPDAPECQCVNRLLNADYVKLKHGNPFADSCWYIPCANRLKYLVTSEFNKDTKCPENICQIIFDTAQTNNVNIDDIKNSINCDFNNGGVIPAPGAFPTIPRIIIYCAIIIAILYIIVYAMKK